MKKLAAILAAIAFSSSAFAAGIDSRAYTCTALHALIAAQRYVFIGNPDFQDFVVADVSSCPAESVLQLRSVSARDNPECLVNYCMPPRGGGGN
jgi:hypothetical protein